MTKQMADVYRRLERLDNKAKKAAFWKLEADDLRIENARLRVKIDDLREEIAELKKERGES